MRYSADGGSSWSTIDNYTFGPGLTTENKSVFMDTNSTIYVVGTYDNNGANSRLLRKSTDLGLTWINEIDSVVASPTITSPKKTIFNAVRDCGSGNVCTAGSEASFDGNTKWIADRF